MADDFVNSFSQGVETGSSLVARARQQKLLAQQEARLNALLPLQQKKLEMDNQLTGIELAQALQNKAYEVEINKAFLTAGELLQHEDPADPMTSMKILDTLIKVPSAHTDPRFKAIMGALDNAQALKVKREEIAARNLRTSAMSTLGKLQTERQAALAAGDTETVKLYDARIAKENAMSKGTRFYDPSTGNLIMEQGGVDSGAPDDPVTKRKLFGKIMSGTALIDAVNQLEPLISSETFGPMARVGGIVNDRLLANIPGMENVASEDRATVGPLVAGLVATYIEDNKTEGPLSEAERFQLMEGIPHDKQFLQSPENTRKVYRAFRRNAARKLAWHADIAGRPVPDAALNILTLDDLLGLNAAGMLSQEATLAAGKRKKATVRP